jgi:Leucine-rich repeat (LRR) protein
VSLTPQSSSQSIFKTDDPLEAFKLARRRIVNNAHRRKQKSLDLTHFGLAEVPPEIGLLSELETLLLSRNRLTRLPAEIGNLKKLQRLYISNNALSVLPPELWRLPRLRILDLSNNQIGELPAGIGQLTSVQNLSLEGNNLARLPEELGQLTRLRDLDLSTNRIQELPSSIGRLAVLNELDLADNELERLPDNITELSALESLTLMGNRLRSLPVRIGSLKKLQWLDLDRNRIESLPESIGDLESLNNLFIANSQLKVLPPQIGNLSNLLFLNVDGNSLSELPPELGKLRQLSSLNVNSNVLSRLPREICELTALTRLFASDNVLEDIPFEIGELRMLRQLLLRNNRLSSLPSSLSKLPLRTLDVAKNRLETVPTEFGELRSLESAVLRPSKSQRQSRKNVGPGLYLDGNPLSDPLPSLIASGQPSATMNVMFWLRGELDPAAVHPPSPSADKGGAPPEPELEAGPDFQITNGRFDLTGVPEERPFDVRTQETLLQLLRRQVSLLQAENVKIGNQHPLLVRTVDEYARILLRPLNEIEVVNLWAVGNGLMAQALAFERQDAHRTISEPLEPLHLGLLVEISRLHGGFVLGFPTGVSLTHRADMARVTPEAVQAIKQPTSDILSSLAKQRRLVSDRVRGLADSLDGALISASWGAARVGHTSYVTLRNFLIEAGKTILAANNASSTFAGGIMLAGAIQASGLTAEAAAQLLEFLRSNTADILSFVAPFPELRAWVGWIIDHIDESDGDPKRTR